MKNTLTLQPVKAIKTWLPMFPGFYETLFQYDEEREYVSIEEFDKLSHEERTQRIKDYEKNVGAEFCKEIEKRLKLQEIDCTIVLDDIYSPKYYNYSNDSINCSITLDVSKLKLFMIKNGKALTPYFRETFTSKPGFTSFFSNDINVWITDYFNLIENKSAILGSILEAILMLKFSQSEICETVYYNGF